MTGLFGRSAVIYCADLVTGLLSAEDVGDSGLPGNNVVLGEVDVDNSFAAHRFVTVTAVTARGASGYLLFSLSGPHNYPSPADISYGAAGPSGPVILVTSSAALGAASPVTQPSQDRPAGAEAGWLLEGSVQQRGCSGR